MTSVDWFARRGASRGAITVEFSLVAAVLAIALLAPWGGEGSVADRLLEATLAFWQGLVVTVAHL